MADQEVTDAYAAQRGVAGNPGFIVDLPDGGHAVIVSKEYVDGVLHLYDDNDGVYVLDKAGVVGITVVNSADTVPGAPTSVAGTPGDTLVHLTWVAPASTGGAAITGYVAYPYIAGVLDEENVTEFGAVLLGDVEGLTNATAYTFKVAAVNEEGEGAQSAASSAITPTA